MSESTPAPGHNSGTVAAERLRSLVERIERGEEERKEAAGLVKDIYVEAKSAGFDTKVLREIIRLRAQDAEKVQEHETLLDTYKHALGM